MGKVFIFAGFVGVCLLAYLCYIIIRRINKDMNG